MFYVDYFETTNKLDPFSSSIIKALLDNGYLKKATQNNEELKKITLAQGQTERPNTEVPSELPTVSSYSGVDVYLNNHRTIEANIETMSKEFLGLCEDRKDWKKSLSAAISEHGHDEVLRAFYEWASAQSGVFMGKKPVTVFFKNIASYVGIVSQVQVSNPNLLRVEERIAYISDNKVFFGGEYRIRLAALIRTHGENLVVRAFEDYFQDVQPKDVQWSAREFLIRASVMISTLKTKDSLIAQKEQQLQSAYTQAEQAVETVDEEETL